MLKSVQPKSKVAPRLASYHVKVRSYTGPFDVLLQLIAEQKVDIEDIDLSKLTEDYLNFLKENLEDGIRLAPEFIQVAAVLILIKTNSLLNEPLSERFDLEDFPLSQDELLKSLKELEQAKKAQALIEEKLSDRQPLIEAQVRILDEDMKAGGWNLSIDKTLLIKIYEEVSFRNPLSVKEKFVGNQTFDIGTFELILFELLEKNRMLSFFDAATRFLKSRKNVIGFFLASLKQSALGKVELHQENLFGDIIISKVSD
ncbi:MAG: segregation/condensation protein A [Actinobacteria bacterium]|nr:segregation/condensation protein A [Actinomycetota bacterium]